MEKLYDKLILFLCCCTFLLYSHISFLSLAAIAVVLAMNTAELLLKKEAANIFCFAFYLALCIRFPVFIFFLPLMSYEMLCEYYSAIVLLGLFPLGLTFLTEPAFTLFSLPLLTFTAYLLKRRTLDLTKAKQDYLHLRNDMLMATERLKHQNQDLMEKQDYEINHATLNERNRIAREIHDTVGHLLSSALLQVGALLTLCKEPPMKEGLSVLKETLSTGMDSIRASIHNLHEDSMDLEHKLQDIIKNFSFCPVDFLYTVEHDFSMKAKYSILFIVKEALSNVMKHSDASRVDISITELPDEYRLIIQDNGTKKTNRQGDYSGMGLQSMLERVHSLNGHYHTDTRNGFQIYVTLPKTLGGL